MPDAPNAPSRPSVSVAIATCDGERWIGRQLDSILRELDPGDQVVVADARSSDRTLDIVRSRSDPRVEIVEGLPRGDIPGTFEAALRRCRGGIVFLSDQDDEWLEGKVARCSSVLADSAAELLLHDARIVDGEDRELAPSFLERIGYRPGLLANLWKPGYLGCALCAKHSLLDRALPFPPRVPMHDWWLGLLAERDGGVAVLREPWILHRRHGRNASYGPGESRFGPWRRLAMRLAILRALLGRKPAKRA